MHCQKRSCTFAIQAEGKDNTVLGGKQKKRICLIEVYVHLRKHTRGDRTAVSERASQTNSTKSLAHGKLRQRMDLFHSARVVSHVSLTAKTDTRRGPQKPYVRHTRTNPTRVITKRTSHGKANLALPLMFPRKPPETDFLRLRVPPSESLCPEEGITKSCEERRELYRGEGKMRRSNLPALLDRTKKMPLLLIVLPDIHLRVVLSGNRKAYRLLATSENHHFPLPISLPPFTSLLSSHLHKSL